MKRSSNILIYLNYLSQSLFDINNAKSRLKELYDVENLEAFGIFDDCALTAAGVLIDYATRTQKGSLPHIRPLQAVMMDTVMDIDAATRRNLEITQTMNGERKGSLLSVMDHTTTPMGGRLLASRLSRPSTNQDDINQRLDEITCLYSHRDIHDTLYQELKSVPDMERALTRLTVGRGSPRDLNAIRTALNACEQIRGLLLSYSDLLMPLKTITQELKISPALQALTDRLNLSLADDVPFLARDGGFIREGYAPQLDE